MPSQTLLELRELTEAGYGSDGSAGRMALRDRVVRRPQFAHGQHGNALSQPTGPYRISSLEYGVKCVLTNKVQQGFFRGAGADPGNFALERLVDAAADEMGIDRAEIRRKNFIRPEQFPYKTPAGNVYDSGNYARVLDRAVAESDLAHWRLEQERLRAEGRYIGLDWPAARNAAPAAPPSGGSGTPSHHAH